MGEVTILGPSCTRPPQIGEGSGGNVACHGLGESQKIKGVEHRTYKSRCIYKTVGTKVVTLKCENLSSRKGMVY